MISAMKSKSSAYNISCGAPSFISFCLCNAALLCCQGDTCESMLVKKGCQSSSAKIRLDVISMVFVIMIIW